MSPPGGKAFYLSAFVGSQPYLLIPQRWEFPCLAWYLRASREPLLDVALVVALPGTVRPRTRLSGFHPGKMVVEGVEADVPAGCVARCLPALGEHVGEPQETAGASVERLELEAQLVGTPGEVEAARRLVGQHLALHRRVVDSLGEFEVHLPADARLVLHAVREPRGQVVRLGDRAPDDVDRVREAALEHKRR